MSKYYIYQQPDNISSCKGTDNLGNHYEKTFVYDNHNRSLDMPIKEFDFYTPRINAWIHTLTKNAGEFYGTGNFCGYYGYSCFRGCDVIADEMVDVNSEGKVFFTITQYDPPTTYDIRDTYTSPVEFEAETDEDAIKYFINYCERERE